MTTPKARNHEGLYRGVLATGLILVLAVNLPGHMTTDSVIQLAEGRTGEQRSFNPAFMSWLLGRFDSLLSGPSLFVAANAALLFVSLAALSRLGPRAHWLAAALAGLVVLTPQVLIYQGVVWKDVMFANTAIAGTICLAFAAERWEKVPGRLALLTAGIVLLAAAALVRQNGALALLAGALGLGLAVGSRRGWSVGLAAAGLSAAAGLVLTLAVSLAMERVMPPAQVQAADVGLRIIQHFDLVGVVSRNPNAHLEPLQTADPKAAATLRALADTAYNPERVDAFSKAESLGRALWKAPEGVVPATWANMVLKDFPDYAAHRLEVFRQVFLTPDLRACLPVTTGIQGPTDVLTELSLPERQDRRDRELYNYATWTYDTPVLSHLPYALISLVLMVVLVLRGRPSDYVMAGLQAGALAFAGSFLVIALACDYRYLYFLDLAALAGVLHLALDPSLAGPRSRRHRT